jgi:hypothetical protein
MESANKPHARPAFLDSPRCGAKTRRGTPCKSPAMKNGRCRMHGGKSTGPPKGTQNALKHGYYARSAIAERRRISKFLRDAKSFLNEVG